MFQREEEHSIKCKHQPIRKGQFPRTEKPNLWRKVHGVSQVVYTLVKQKELRAWDPLNCTFPVCTRRSALAALATGGHQSSAYGASGEAGDPIQSF